ncbi:DUF6887 family protein [Microcoleus sp. FACHB-SPT15]|uniref:DUF6887 family protein n=1 Tax=Microcoleus sp. FACHB-SPT15 TaxID=2692830 RepID=UPI0028C3E64C|nr:hypothetical protein [Microcoleus sp. FACHB-SPT15]
MPTDAQLRCLYRIGYQLTYMLFQPIHLICIDGRTQNLYILAGQNEEIEARNYSKWRGAVMSQVDYTAMSYKELRRYFLKHREDQAAFQAYLSRRRERSRPVITRVDDPDFDNKIQTAIRQQLAEHRS